MIAFDADVLTLILAGDQRQTKRAAQYPAHDQTVPIVVLEELLRGRLNSIRQAESGQTRLTVERAYELLDETVTAFRQSTHLPYTAQADSLVQQWRGQRVRIGTHDLRIAAICVSQSATLISRNRRDFDQVPGLQVEYWG